MVKMMDRRCVLMREYHIYYKIDCTLILQRKYPLTNHFLLSSAKNFQSGWYTNAQESFYPLDNKNSVVERTLIGVNNYQVSPGMNNGNLVTLRLGDDRYDPWWGYNTGGDDYYLGFNLKEGINEGTEEGANRVLLFQKVVGGPTQSGESDRIKDLDPGDSYTIINFKGTFYDVTITVSDFINNGRNAPIRITTECGANGCGEPTGSPTESCSDNGGRGRFSLELNTGPYPFETSWELLEQESGAILATVPYTRHDSNKQYLYPSPAWQDEKYYCLTPSQCYTFKIQDRFSDGFFRGRGNYKLRIDELVFVGGSVENFQAEELYSFCIKDNDDSDDEPTLSPIPLPTRLPTPRPTVRPTQRPTQQPTQSPTNLPTNSQTNATANAPTNAPKLPIESPSSSPSVDPSGSPSRNPSPGPSKSPSRCISGIGSDHGFVCYT